MSALPASAAAMRGVRPSGPVAALADAPASRSASMAGDVAEGRGRRERAVGRPGPARTARRPRPAPGGGALRLRVVERREQERRAAALVRVVEVDVRCCFQQVFHLFGVSGFTGLPELIFIT